MKNQTEKKIIILIPAYNAEKTIQTAIESILVQTYVNWQVYVINDGSQDNTVEVVKELFRDEDRIVTLSLPEGKGKTHALRYGIDYVPNGDYVMFLDSDDQFKDVTLFEKLIYEFEAENADSICFNYEIMGRLGFPKLYKKVVMDSDKEYVKNIMNRQVMDGNIWGGIYKFADVKDSFLAQEYNHEDYANKFNILGKCSKVVILPIVGYIYNVNPNGITHKTLSDKDKYYYIHAKEFTDSICDRYPDLKTECEYFSNWILLWTVTRLNESTKEKELSMYKSMMHTARKEIKVFLLNPYFSTRERIRWVLVQLRLYRFADKFYQRIRK